MICFLAHASLWKKSALRCLPLVLLFVCLAALPGPPSPPEEVLASCLAVDHFPLSRVSIDPVAGRVEVMESGPASPYSLYLPDGDNRQWRIGYASGKPPGRDYLFVNSHRGYLDRAIGLSPERAPRLSRPQKASFAVLGFLGERYLCLMEVHGHGPRSGQRSVYVARIPTRMGAEMSLYYKLAASPALPQLPAASSSASPSSSPPLQPALPR
ncbi:hypothetical protein J2X56_000990 [Herbaspirillum sp. 1173]|uniref:hypothetical protein n=1 Tax=Herbaspirillum sp. 1173 TaxID=2817734 RepID=UPI00285DA1E8|nr:hypothetical protein [Herbaspirillum sp. 1173]MDR6739004.1 hypothetical protein [Herbaspirillum sp. 1173]